MVRADCRMGHGTQGAGASIAIQDDSGQEALASVPCVRETTAVLRLGEAQSQALEREPAPLTDDEVIEQLDIEQLPGGHDLHREGHVGRRGRRIAGGWLWTATRAVACWRTASRKTSLVRRQRAPRKRVRRENGSGRQVQRATIFLDHELAGAVNHENDQQRLLRQQEQAARS